MNYVETLRKQALQHCWLTRKRPVAVRLGVQERARLDCESTLVDCRLDAIAATLSGRAPALLTAADVKHVTAFMGPLDDGWMIAIEPVEYPEHLEWVDE